MHGLPTPPAKPALQRSMGPRKVSAKSLTTKDTKVHEGTLKGVLRPGSDFFGLSNIFQQTVRPDVKFKPALADVWIGQSNDP